MRKFARRLVCLFAALAMFSAMTATAAAAEYDIDALYCGDSFTMKYDDTIKGSATDGNYFTVVGGAFGSYFGDSTNVEDPNAIIYETTFSSVAYGEIPLVWICSGPGSIYKPALGFYEHSMTVEDALRTIDVPGASEVTLKVIGATSSSPFTYTINYDANGGEGTIASQTWTYTEMGQNLSDGSGFTRDGYKLACWAIAVSGDENEDGIIDEYDGYLTFDLGDTLDLGPDITAGGNIPSYATITDGANGKAEITLYAIWEKIDGTGGADSDGPDDLDDTDKADADRDSSADTGDNMMIAPFIALTVLSGLGAVLLLRRKEA